MTQYLSKSALVAEIEKIIPQRAYERETLHSEFVRGQRVAYNKILSFLNILEVKKVDSNDVFIEKAEKWFEDLFIKRLEWEIITYEFENVQSMIEDFKNYIKGE